MFDPFTLLFSLFVVFFVAFFAFIFFAIFTGILNNRRIAARNRASPLVSREAFVVAKRQDVSGGGQNLSASTSYYVTFEFANATREEFGVSGREYGQLAEGDRGTLLSQGTWYKGFERF